MNEYEKYRLQWMLDHDYSLPDLLERLSDIAMNENLDEIQNPRVMLNEAFERLEYEQGFDNEEIWLCKDEWEHDLYSSNEYSLTDAGKTKVKHFIEDCRIKQDSILKAGLDTAKETTLPSVEDILCNVEDMVDEDGAFFLSTVQLENETVEDAMEEYYYNITKGGFYIPDRIKEGYMEEDNDNLSKGDIEL